MMAAPVLHSFTILIQEGGGVMRPTNIAAPSEGIVHTALNSDAFGAYVPHHIVSRIGQN